MTAASRTGRLFAAIAPPQELAAEVEQAAAPLRSAAPSLNWVDHPDLHVTVVFLGFLDEEVAAAASEALAGVADATGSFDVALSGSAGTFGSRVLWAGVEPSAALEALAEAARTAVALAGVEVEERAFRAHVTLARAGRRGRLPRGLAETYAGPATAWRVERLRLWGPAVRGAGVRYAERASWLLAG